MTLTHPVVVNIVATAELGQSVDLAQISKIEHTIFDQEIYGCRAQTTVSLRFFDRVKVTDNIPPDNLKPLNSRRQTSDTLCPVK